VNFDYLDPIFERVVQEAEDLDTEIRERMKKGHPGWTRQDAERLALTVALAVASDVRHEKKT